MEHSEIKLNQTRIDLKDLRLDPNNPRLPEESIGASQPELMKVFYRDYDLDELASSFLENGFFEAEALVTQENIVKEGNRRLAALKYLLHDEDAAEADLPVFDTDEPIEESKLDALRMVPVFEAPSDADLSSYLGFHHINGPLQWSASAKARYIVNRVDAVAKAGDDRPFVTISKEIGSNTQGVRNAYRQYALLRVARDLLDLRKEATYILDKRFGVWARLTSSSAVYDYIGFHPAGTDYAEIFDALEDDESFDRDNFKTLLNDLVPSASGEPALLNDSRRASIYTTALENPKLINTLRESRDYSLVKSLIDGSTVNERLGEVAKRLSGINDDVVSGGEVDESTINALEKIIRIANGIKGVAQAAIEDDSDME